MFARSRPGRVLIRCAQLVLLWAVLGCFSSVVEVSAGTRFIRVGSAYGHSFVVLDANPTPRGWSIDARIDPNTRSAWWHSAFMGWRVVHRPDIQFSSVAVGNWVPLLLALGLVVWRTKAKHPKGACVGCGYPRAGLGPDATCPECAHKPGG